VQLTVLKHQHERQNLDPGALRLSGKRAHCSYRRRLETIVRGGADKSLARPGRKEATTTKLGFIQPALREAHYIS